MSNKQRRADRRAATHPAAPVELGPVSAGHVHSQSGWHVTVIAGGDGPAALRQVAEGQLPDLFADYRQDAYGGTWSVYLGDPNSPRDRDAIVTQCPGLREAYESAAHVGRHLYPGATILHLLRGDPNGFNAAIGLAEVTGDFGAMAGPAGIIYSYPPA